MLLRVPVFPLRSFFFFFFAFVVPRSNPGYHTAFRTTFLLNAIGHLRHLSLGQRMGGTAVVVITELGKLKLENAK